ncbi:MAG: DUF2489 domain-containing protein [Pontibacterium sp.]
MLSDQVLYIASGVGVLVCLGLLVFIVKKGRELEQAKAEQAAAQAKLSAQAQEQRDYLTESIRVIANAMLYDEKLTQVEGCIRISNLLDRVAPHLKDDPELAIIGQIEQETAHIPYLDKWKALSKQAKWKYTQEMKRLEVKHASALEVAAKRLSDFSSESISH